MKSLFTFLLSLVSLTGFSQQVDLVTPLQNSLIETSGLMLLDNRLITHNDSGGAAALFEIDSTSGGIARTVVIENAPNVDWEDLCHDDTYIYIADFGNNAGSRTNLRVYRVLISDYLNTPNDTISADTISFDYADQTDFTPSSFSTNYDAEAIISLDNNLYIFTKNWGDMWTNIYALPKTPGNYSIPRIDSIDVDGFITGASFNASSNSVMLSGYAFTYPFIVEISNFSNAQFSSGTINREQIQLPSGYSYQLEGISPIGESNYYISTEESFSGTSGLFRLHSFPTNSLSEQYTTSYSIYPNPSSDYLHIFHPAIAKVDLYNSCGKLITSTTNQSIDISDFPGGVYLALLSDVNGKVISREKIMVK